jgi:antitoxin component of MazEF toxin-antitoxin module
LCLVAAILWQNAAAGKNFLKKYKDYIVSQKLRVMSVKKDIRKVVRVGGSLGITLPRKYIESSGLKKDDFLEIYFDEQHNLICIKPISTNETNKKLRQLLNEVLAQQTQ